MKTLLVILLLTCPLFSQITFGVVEDFSVIVDSAKAAQYGAHYFFMPGVDPMKNYGSDAFSLSDTNGTFADSVLPSQLRGGNMRYFDGNFDFRHTSGLTAPGQNNFTWIAGLRTADEGINNFPWGQYTSTSNHFFGRVTNGLDMIIRTFGASGDRVSAMMENFGEQNQVVIYSQSTSRADTFYNYVNASIPGTISAILFDKEGNYNVSSAEWRIGRYGASTYTGFIDFIFYNRTTYFTAKQIEDFTYLSPGWVSNGGDVSRTTGAAWGKSQGISAAEAEPCAIKTKNGAFTETYSAVTGDSTRFITYYPDARTYATDTLYVIAEGDTIIAGIQDTSFSSIQGTKLTVDLWHDSGNSIMYVDNLLLEPYTSGTLNDSSKPFEGDFNPFEKF